MRRVVAGALLAAAAGALVACAPGYAERIVDGWRIGPPRSCADLALNETDCSCFTERARSYAAETGGPVVSWTLHETRKISPNGSPELIVSGAGVPVGVLVVQHADGTERVALMGCSQARGATAPTRVDCP